MDKIIKRFESVRDGDLTFCRQRQVAYQSDIKKISVKYDAAYLANYQRPEYSNSEIARAVTRGRCALVKRHIEKGTNVFDIGACTGAFMRAATAEGYWLFGFDVIPEVVSRLKEENRYTEDVTKFEAITMWDSIEHMRDPDGSWLSKIKKDAHLFISVPIMPDIESVRSSKHYKPGEHLYYWTQEGFINWMALYGFALVEVSDHEVKAGRQDIGAFVFKKSLPDYRDHIAAYEQIHFTRHYGSSATGLYLDTVAKVVNRLKPKSILDYGCGRSDLVAHFWKDGERKIARYDPAIPALREMPDGLFSLVLCCDVLEHIPMSYVDKVLLQIRHKSSRAIFSISTKPSRAKLPDGRNAHVTLLTKTEWMDWIREYFLSVEILESDLDHELVLLAGAP